MDQEIFILSDQIRANGRITKATLSSRGELEWFGRRLDVQKQVLGFSVEGSSIKIRAVVETAAGICCSGGKTNLIRRTFSLELLSNDSLRIWSQRLQEYLDSLGKLPGVDENCVIYILFSDLNFQFCVFGFR